MEGSSRDLKKPKRYCCEAMKQTLAKNDMIRYIWDSRDYALVSSVTPIVQSFIDFCPFCGENIGADSVLDEYEEVYDQATNDDETFRDPNTTLESFGVQFLTALEAEEEKRLGHEVKDRREQPLD